MGAQPVRRCSRRPAQEPPGAGARHLFRGLRALRPGGRPGHLRSTSPRFRHIQHNRNQLLGSRPARTADPGAGTAPGRHHRRQRVPARNARAVQVISDRVLARLKAAAELPDLSGTRYRLIDEIGRGGMGVVYRAEDPQLARFVAIKILDDGSEARVLASLEHPGIVPVHEAGMLPDGRSYYAMKLIRGTRLDAFLAKTPHPPPR